MMSVLARTGRSLVQGSKVARTYSVHSRCKYAGPRTTPSLKLATATRTLLFANAPIASTCTGTCACRFHSTFVPSTFESIDDEIKDANERCAGNVGIHTTSDRGWGLLASKSFSKGDKIFTTNAIATVPRDSHSLQKGWDTHVRIDLPGRFMNHSCDGNMGIQDNDTGAYDLYALREIKEGEELLVDYESFEYEIKGFDHCMCGSEKCRGSVGGFKENGAAIKEQYGNYYANYLKEA